MIERIKNLRTKLINRKPSVGAWIQIPHESIVEIFASEGYEWIVIDLEHGSISVHQLPGLFRTIEYYNSLPLARLTSDSPIEIKRVLDAGARGIIIPNIESKNQLQEVILNSKWPPAGKRGVGFSRSNIYGKKFTSYSIEAQEPIIIGMIESKKGVDNIDEILQVKGLDAILIGPYDLSGSLGITADFNNKEFQNSLKKIKASADKYEIALGIHIIEPEQSELINKINEGYSFLPFSLDSYMLNKVATNPLK